MDEFVGEALKSRKLGKEVFPKSKLMKEVKKPVKARKSSSRERSALKGLVRALKVDVDAAKAGGAVSRARQFGFSGVRPPANVAGGRPVATVKTENKFFRGRK